jgi:hypothetical protein
MVNLEDHKDHFERMKLLFDLGKHITTLATGTMLLMAGFYERVFKFPAWKLVAAGSFICFALAVLCSVVAMLCFASYSRKTYGTLRDPINAGAYFFTAGLVSLFFGVLLFVFFVLKNL